MTKTPNTRQSTGVLKEQIALIPEPEFSPIWPRHTTVAGRVLAEFLRGQWLDHEDLIAGCRSWRLAAYVRDLKDKGWPIEAIEKPAPSPGCQNRSIAVYGLPPLVIEQVKQIRGLA